MFPNPNMTQRIYIIHLRLPLWSSPLQLQRTSHFTVTTNAERLNEGTSSRDKTRRDKIRYKARQYTTKTQRPSKDKNETTRCLQRHKTKTNMAIRYKNADITGIVFLFFNDLSLFPSLSCLPCSFLSCGCLGAIANILALP